MVYSHRKNEYITIDVDCDSRLLYFLYEWDLENVKNKFMKEVMEFIIDCENRQKAIKEMLEGQGVPFN